MRLEELDRWLDVYGRAWERQDTDAFVFCFTEDAAYFWGPWGEPLRGHAEIRARAEQAIASQENIQFGHEPERTIEEDEGIFLVTLDADGKCADFRKWWNNRSRPAAIVSPA
jgi:ketosteroid isomerase-like protein